MRKFYLLFIFLYLLAFVILVLFFLGMNNRTVEIAAAPSSPIHFTITAVSPGGQVMANQTTLTARDIRNYPFLGETRIKPIQAASIEFIYNGIVFLGLPDSQFAYSPQSDRLLLLSGTFFWTSNSRDTVVNIAVINPNQVMNPSTSGKIVLQGAYLEMWNFSGELTYRTQNSRIHLRPLSYTSTLPAINGAIWAIAPPPEEIDPDERIIFFDDKAAPVVNFDWRGIAGVATYLFRIYSSPMKEDMLSVQQVDGNSITVNIMPYVDQGHFYWDVCGFDPGRKLESAPSKTGLVQLSGTFFAQKATAKPPELTLFPFTISGNMVVIKGIATPGAQLFIDNNPVTMDSQGNFTYTVFYPSTGEKEIVFNVVSSAGLTTTQKRQVVVSDISI